MPTFQSKQAMNKYHISLNSQFVVVSDGIICFSVWHNSLLVLKMHFQVFSLASKKVQGFSSERKILNIVVVISALSSTQRCLSFLKS